MTLFSFHGGRKVTLEVARKILGSGRVFSQQDVINALSLDPDSVHTRWGVDLATEHSISYSTKVIRRCAKENRKGHRWRLIFRTGLSASMLRTLLPDEFESASVWESKLPFLDEIGEPGYRLVDFSLATVPPVVGKKDIWGYARAHVTAVAENLIVIRRITQSRYVTRRPHRGQPVGNEYFPLLESYATGKILFGTRNAGLFYSYPDSFPSVFCIVRRTS